MDSIATMREGAREGGLGGEGPLRHGESTEIEIILILILAATLAIYHTTSISSGMADLSTTLPGGCFQPRDAARVWAF